jgi:Tfp pilus assembly protein PilO
MNLSPRNRFFALAVGAVLLVVAMAAGLVFPQFGRITKLATDIKTAKDEALAAKTLLDQRRQIKNEAASTDASLLQLQNAVPENPEMPSLIIALQDRASAVGVSLESVSVNGPKANTTYLSLPFSIVIWGTWSDTIEYMQQLRRLDRQLRIVEFNTAIVTPEQLSAVKLSAPPYYQVKTTLSLEAYAVPEISSPASGTPIPAAPPAQ